MSLNVSFSAKSRRRVYKISFGLPVEPDVVANLAFEWCLGAAFLIERSTSGPYDSSGVSGRMPYFASVAFD
jgi:hypothetical protein